MSSSTVARVEGRAISLPGNDIDTDRIMPARFLKAVTFEGLEAHLFEDDRREAAAAGGAVHPVSDPAYGGATVMLVNGNFGCGSSREHAPQAIRRRGIRAVVGQSFSEIFFGKSVALGMPCPTASAAAMQALMSAVEQDPTSELVVDLAAMRVAIGDRSFELSMPAPARDAFLDGSWDATGLLLENYDEVRALAARLPYVTGNW